MSIEVRGMEKTLRNLEGAVTGMPTAIERAVMRSGVLLRNQTVLQLSGTGTVNSFLGRMGAPAPFLGKRTGFTRASLTPTVQVYRSGSTVFTSVGSPEKYLKILEQGGTISGKKGMLAIPLNAAQSQNKQGGTTGQVRGQFAGHSSLRDVPGLFPIKSKRGNVFLVRQKTKRSRMEFLFLLKKSVTIPPRQMFSTVRARVAPEVFAMTGGEVETVMRKANGG